MTNTQTTSKTARPPAWANIALCVFVIGCLLGLTEVFLRYQPFVTLDYPKSTLDPEARLSMLYNHRTQSLPDPQLASWGECESPTARHVKLLFLGDSWMEPMDGIPRGFAETLIAGAVPNACYDVTNGGTRSFSPSPILTKGRKLIAEHRPDFVVIYIDETDVMDETVHYSRTTLRGPGGEMERVVPGIADLAQAYERPVLVQQRSYALRLLEQIYYEKVLMPRIVTAVYGSPEPVGDYSRIMAMQLSRDPDGEFREELEYFRARFREMLHAFVESVGTDRILIARHPHYLHLSIGGERPRYNESLSKILREETSALHVMYYDAGAHLAEIYGGNATRYMRWPADPFSHLTDEGSRLFGRELGKVARERIAADVAATGQAPAEDAGSPAPAPR